jgi:hypothetical protein
VSAITQVLDRLQRVKQVRPSQWKAACPICKSKEGRPVYIKEADGGRVLLHGFCGHTTGELVEALGLSIGDLFERPIEHRRGPERHQIPARDLLDMIDREALVIATLALELKAEGDLWDEQWERIATAAARIGWARDAAHGG